MRAIVTRPGEGRAWLQEVREPTLTRPDDVLVEMLRVGVCGTDRHVMARAFDLQRQLPEGEEFLVLGHEAVGRVARISPGVRDLQVGDLVVPTVRRGCNACEACAAEQADLCFTARYRERGIVGLHGFLSERIVDSARHLIRIPAELAGVAPLVESLCTPEKALRRINNARAHLPVGGTMHGVRRALVTGSGPIALLALLALRLREVPTAVVARQPPDGLPASLVRRAGGEYIRLQEVDLERPRERLGDFDAIVEATGAAELCVAMLGALAPNGVLDLAGGAGGASVVPVQASALSAMLGRNLTMLGSVNANADDWRAAIDDLGAMRQAFPGVIEALITHHFRMEQSDIAFERVPGQIKAVIDISNST